MSAVNFPLRISYPASLPYASVRVNAVEKAGDRVIITYNDASEFRACLELHKEAHRMQADITTEYAKSRLIVATRELI